MRLAIVGSRDFPNLELVHQRVLTLPSDTIVISGGGRGVDEMAEATARQCGLVVVSYRPVKSKPTWLIEKVTFRSGDSDDQAIRTILEPTRELISFGKAAHYRNALIVEDCESLLAFHKPPSNGTQAGIDLARLAGKPVEVVLPEEGWQLLLDPLIEPSDPAGPLI